MICVMPVRNTVTVIYILIYYTGKKLYNNAVLLHFLTLQLYSILQHNYKNILQHKFLRDGIGVGTGVRPVPPTILENQKTKK